MNSIPALVGWLILVGLGLARVVVPDVGIWAPAFDVAHFLFFAVLAAQLFRLLAGVRSELLRAALVFLLTLGAVVALEALQPWIKQEKDSSDVWIGASGCLAALLAIFAWRRPTPAPRIALILIGFAITLAAIWSPCALLAARVVSASRFPLLASFESSAAMRLWDERGCSLSASGSHATHGSRSAEIRTAGDGTSYPGISLAVWPRNWLGYRALCMDVETSPGSVLVLWVRLDDKLDPSYDDRFQARCALRPGSNAVRVELDAGLLTPSGRRFDLSQVRRLTIFFEESAVPRSCYLDHVRLVQSP